ESWIMRHLDVPHSASPETADMIMILGAAIVPGRPFAAHFDCQLGVNERFERVVYGRQADARLLKPNSSEDFLRTRMCVNSFQICIDRGPVTSAATPVRIQDRSQVRCVRRMQIWCLQLIHLYQPKTTALEVN